MIDDTRPTLAERYSTASESGNLRVSVLRQTDADILMAAGWSSEGIGSSLLRLRSEFDSIRAEHELAERTLLAAEAAADAMDQRARQATAETADAIAKAAKAAHKGAEDSARTARALIMIRINTLPGTRNALGRLAIIHATKARFMRPDGDVLRLVGRCLDVWLDPTCPRCSGRGFTGGYDGPQVLCRPCGGGGKRTGGVGMDDEERRFAKHILALMDRSTAAAEAQMRRLLNWAPETGA